MRATTRTGSGSLQCRREISVEPIVFHKKNGRRHAHAVCWRIYSSAMKAINLPHYKMKFRDVERLSQLDGNRDGVPCEALCAE